MHAPVAKHADVLIIGGGVTGTALLYLLGKYTNVGKVLLLERRSAVAQVSSAAAHNSQTLHFGDIETNYTLEKAKAVKQAAEMIVAYAEMVGGIAGKGILEKAGTNGFFLRPMQKMVLGVGRREVAKLKERAKEFNLIFPQTKFLGPDELRKIEPMVMVGRADNESVAALYSARGFAADFGRLAASFAAEAVRSRPGFAEVTSEIEVTAIARDGDGFTVTTDHGDFRARTVVVSAGGMSLAMAHRMGLGRDLTLLPVAGNFFTAPNKLKGKVYTVQEQGLPFAAVHADPDVNDPGVMRFGPIAIATPILEPGRWRSMLDFFRVFRINLDTLASVIKVNTDPVVLRFVSRHLLFYLPFVGKYLFLNEARKIVPSIRAADLHFARELGGVRPQIANIKTRSLQLGEAKIIGERIIFNITPSPGASVCLKTAEDDMHRIAAWLGDDCRIDEEAFQRDFG